MPVKKPTVIPAIRPATHKDATGMSAVLGPILSMLQSQRRSDPDHIIQHYIEHPDKILCCVAEGNNAEILGFQSLIIATDGNPYGVRTGWGIIGTYVNLNAGRRGIGSALFAATLQAARNGKITDIDATIGTENRLGLGYYAALGFETYRNLPNAICKCYKVGSSSPTPRPGS
ncbi:MAG TPA: GNAT family N-acetyltransferase [Rhodobacteraceae bacterium]|jgi:GNAT superfamily N-acetyltransferase|nr:GNAT family N-acetyltransferase [Paracoccaceae bacterium]